jgi:small nuclear ribonucleoprotein (snRNP)-like protein
MLARRLTQRGLALSAGSLALLLSQNAMGASLPASLAVSTVKAATLVAAGQAATAGLISAQVAALTEGVLKAMLLTKLKIATVVMLTVSLLGTGAGYLTHQALAEKPVAKGKPTKEDPGKGPTELSGVLKAVDASKRTITLHPSKGHLEGGTFDLAASPKVFLDDGTGDKLGFQEGKLADLTDGVHVTLRFQDEKVVRIWVEGPTLQGILKSVDPANNTITATLSMAKSQPLEDKTFAVARNAGLSIDDGKVKDKSKPSKGPSLADLPLNAVVFLRLSADRKVVGSIRAEGQTVHGILKAVDAGKSTITVTFATKGVPAEDKTFKVAKDAQIYVDEGTKEKPIKLPVISLADAPIGAHVTLRMSLDQQSVVALRAEGSSAHGTVKSVDAGKN